MAGAPKVQSDLIREMPLWIGTMMHERIHNMLRSLGVPYMAEVNLTPWLPAGWGGTADGLFWNPELKAFVLTDFKSQKGEGMRYIVRDGAKDEHRFQTSLYWHAVKKMGLPLAKAIAVYYLPKNDTRNKDELIEPVLIDFTPIPKRQLEAIAKERFHRLLDYEGSLPFCPTSTQIRDFGVDPDAVETPDVPLDAWLTDELEPVQEREQRIYYDRNTETWDVKLVPHWSAAFCPFPDELCDCNRHGQTKIGMFDVDGSTYVPRTGYEEIEPAVFPAT